MNFRKRVLSIMLTLTVAATMLFTPAVSFADSTVQWETPTEPMSVDKDIVTVAGHAANSTCVHFLGANLITDRASDVIGSGSYTTDKDKLDAVMSKSEMGVFGTSANVSPDPYWWNFAYNLYASVNGKTLTTPQLELVSANPMGADLTEVSGYEDLTVDGSNVPHSVGMMPDIMLGINGQGGKSYDDYIKKMREYKGNGGAWDPVQLAYKAGSLSDFVDDMYNLSDAIKSTGKKGRYGDTEAIAKNYEEYIKGLQLYVMSQIDAGKVAKKTVAVVDPSTLANGEYQVYNSSMAKGTAASTRAAEYVENTTDNVIDVCGIANSGTEESKKYMATAKQLVENADAIFITVQAQINVTGDAFRKELAEAAGCDISKVPPVYANDPNGVFSIRANSVENFVGIGVYQGFLYPELINPVYAATYVYDKFYHLSSGSRKNVSEYILKDTSLPEGVTVDTAGYSRSYIDKKINTGMAYYYANKAKYADTKLEATDRLSSSDYKDEVVKTDISSAKISSVSSRTYNGKAQTPSVTVKVGKTTLKKNTDYTVAYKNNTKPGKATVTITGKGNYTGKKTVTFKIVPKKQTLSRVYSPKKGQLKVSWKKDSTVSGYQVVIARNSKYTTGKKYSYVSGSKNISRTFTKLSKGKVYYAKVRAYKVIDGKKVYGSYSASKKIKVRK